MEEIRGGHISLRHEGGVVFQVGLDLVAGDLRRAVGGVHHPDAGIPDTGGLNDRPGAVGGLQRLPATEDAPAELNAAQKAGDLTVGEGEDAAGAEGLVVEDHGVEHGPQGVGVLGAGGGVFHNGADLLLLRPQGPEVPFI